MLEVKVCILFSIALKLLDNWQKWHQAFKNLFQQLSNFYCCGRATWNKLKGATYPYWGVVGVLIFLPKAMSQ